MMPTLVIALREFLEVFLMIGVFLGISKQLRIGREKEILAASCIGTAIALFMPLLLYVYGDRVRSVITKENAELLESYLMVFSGFFIAYVVFSLHKTFARYRSNKLIQAHQKLQQNIFDISLFLTIVFFIVREGFEIALFTATTSLFSRFVENVFGLLMGFFISMTIGFFTFVGYMKFSVAKIFRTTEYFIILLGASFVKNGLSELADQYLHIHLSSIVPITFKFVPSSSSFAGHLLNSLFGIERDMSLATIFIMFVYICFVYLLFLRKKAPGITV